MLRRALFMLLTLLVFACQQSGPVDLERLEGRARAGDQQALEELVALLGNNHENLNGRVYALLLEIGPPAVPFLRARATDPNDDLREHAIAALGNLQDAGSVVEIGRVLDTEGLRRRYIAAWALGEIGTPETLPFLLRAIDDPDPEVRKATTRALIKLNRSAVPALIDALGRLRGEGQAAAVRALGDIGDPRAVSPLLELVDGANRPEVVLALGKLKDPRAEQALVAALADPAWQVRMNAAMALGPLGSRAAVASLRRTLDDEVMVVREWSARSLAMITGEQVMYRDSEGELVPPYEVYH